MTPGGWFLASSAQGVFEDLVFLSDQLDLAFQEFVLLAEEFDLHLHAADLRAEADGFLQAFFSVPFESFDPSYEVIAVEHLFGLFFPLDFAFIADEEFVELESSCRGDSSDDGYDGSGGGSFIGHLGSGGRSRLAS